ncbi:hypothetical protein PM082_000688 [Marasmius tenuissimus]|nr:hypothetical protein PM082_000688 [Marasmius tenuissimus]
MSENYSSFFRGLQCKGTTFSTHGTGSGSLTFTVVPPYASPLPFKRTDSFENHTIVSASQPAFVYRPIDTSAILTVAQTHGTHNNNNETDILPSASLLPSSLTVRWRRQRNAISNTKWTRVIILVRTRTG